MSNKIIKFVLLMLFMITSISGAYIIKNNSVDSEIMSKYDLPTYRQLYLPDTVLSEANFKTTVQLIKGVSTTTRTPFIFRTLYSGESSNGKGSMNELDEINQVTFYQTEFVKTNEQNYSSHGARTSISNAPLTQLDYEQYVASSLFVAANNSSAVQQLTEAINKQFKLSLTQQSLLSSPDTGVVVVGSSNGFLDTNLPQDVFIGASFIFYAVFLFIWLVENSKEISVYRLEGMGVLKITNNLFMRGFLIALVSSFTLSTLFVFTAINLNFILLLSLYTCITFAINLLAILLVSRNSLVNQINSKPFLKFSYVILYVVKVLIFTISVSTTIDSVNLLNMTLKLNPNQALDHYAVLYPNVTGYSAGNFDNGNLGNMKLTPTFSHTFQYAESHGAILAQYNPSNTYDKLQTLQVNDNYLKKVSLVDASGKKVTINPQDSDSVLLLSENMKPDLKAIKSFYATMNQSVPKFKSSQLEVYFIKNNQQVPVYEGSASTLYGGETSTTTPQIVEVYTAANVSNRFGNTFLFNGGNPDALLFPIKGSLTTMYLDLLPALKADNVSSQFPSLIAANDVPKTSILLVVGNVSQYIFVNVFPFTLFILMIFSTTSFYFKVYKKRIAILRLQGFSWVRVYRHFFVVLTVQYLYCFIFTLVTEMSPLIFELFAVYLVIECLIVALMLRRLERNSLLSVLKGE